MVGQELQVVLTELKLHGELEVDLRVAYKHSSELTFRMKRSNDHTYSSSC